MRYEIQRTTQFRRDVKAAIKRGYDLKKLHTVITLLANGEPLPEEYHNHPLSGKPYQGYWECHIEPDWLLVYKITKSVLILSLYRTGTHSDLF